MPTIVQRIRSSAACSASAVKKTAAKQCVILCWINLIYLTVDFKFIYSLATSFLEKLCWFTLMKYFTSASTGKKIICTWYRGIGFEASSGVHISRNRQFASKQHYIRHHHKPSGDSDMCFQTGNIFFTTNILCGMKWITIQNKYLRKMYSA